MMQVATTPPHSLLMAVKTKLSCPAWKVPVLHKLSLRILNSHSLCLGQLLSINIQMATRRMVILNCLLESLHKLYHIGSD